MIYGFRAKVARKALGSNTYEQTVKSAFSSINRVEITKILKKCRRKKQKSRDKINLKYGGYPNEVAEYCLYLYTSYEDRTTASTIKAKEQ